MPCQHLPFAATLEHIMQIIRKSSERGYADHGWLKSYHSFSFAGYHDPAHMGFGNLRVINEDKIAAGSGFGTHGHQDMEIVSYVLSGALGHKDSLGTGASIQPGDVQRMSAGTGIQHSEFNHADNQQTHFLQIWLLHHTRAIAPSYAQQHFSDAQKRGQLRLVVSPEGTDGSVSISADARIYAGLFDGDEQAQLALAAERLTYVQVVRGQLRVNGEQLMAGDALKLSAEPMLRLDGGVDAEVLVFDLAN
jgi:quercetin 2,3-dioxygenase